MSHFSEYIAKLRASPIEVWDRAHVLNVLMRADEAVQDLKTRNQYVEDSLVAATTGELPERFDLNQLLLAQRAKAYIKWLLETKDPRDKLVPPPEVA